MEDEVKFLKGVMTFAYIKGKMQYTTYEYDDLDRQMNSHKADIYDLMSGEEFVDCVECGGFIDYDGTLAEIYVDDYVTNLGISDYGIHQGNFRVDLKKFREICKNYKVEVNWANK